MHIQNMRSLSHHIMAYIHIARRKIDSRLSIRAIIRSRYILIEYIHLKLSVLWHLWIIYYISYTISVKKPIIISIMHILAEYNHTYETFRIISNCLISSYDLYDAHTSDPLYNHRYNQYIVNMNKYVYDQLINTYWCVLHQSCNISHIQRAMNDYPYKHYMASCPICIRI